ncbi:hypothetical protein QEZ54_20415 [Catellatospora sp. KI3]|uniref:hypothetical protein n=1 Tax=Catellatospora sp. KI3 TaxID=3041620 RepID=UPI002482D54A|nr:hypothetical protein [Catellatospora sp. KI3]MDI1463350.1 hypothetical protein [Catellatospora sp. KI3]
MGEKSTNSEIHDLFGLRIAKAPREALEMADLIRTEKGPNRATIHELTKQGWERARAELAAMAPKFTANAGPAWGRLLYGALNVLDRLMTEKKLEMAHVFGTPATSTAQSWEPEAHIDMDDQTAIVESRVLAVYDELAPRPGDLVSLARLRGKMADVPRADLDRVLKAMDRGRIIQLDPDPNRKALPPEAIEAAINIGGEDKHLLTVVR